MKTIMKTCNICKGVFSTDKYYSICKNCYSTKVIENDTSAAIKAHLEKVMESKR